VKYSIGYQLPDEAFSIVDLVRDYREHVADVYFAMPGQPSGREPLGLGTGASQAEIGEVMQEELGTLAGMDIGLVLLLNASCYGEEAIAGSLASSVQETVRGLRDAFGLRSVTTASPFIARVVKEMGLGVKVQASVNMRVGTLRAMEFLAPDFDGFYLQREYNRDLDHIRSVSQWCRLHGKDLFLLANSGCMRDCPWQAFHDNLVAHEHGVRSSQNVPSPYPSPCWEYLADSGHWSALLQNTWIRPEDLHHYEEWFGTVKLATRMHASPRRVLDAYARGSFRGNLLDLMEPGYGPMLHPYIVDNTRFPADFFEQTTSCNRDCTRCGYCESVMNKVLVEGMELPASEE
jgi:hypothetical protein